MICVRGMEIANPQPHGMVIKADANGASKVVMR